VLWFPSNDLVIIVAWFTTPVPVSVNNSNDFTSAVMSILSALLYAPPAPSWSYHVTVRVVKLDGSCYVTP